MRVRCRFDALLFAAALLLTPALGLADAYDAAFARAIAAKERALDENDPAAWEEALDRFEQADRLRATPECKYELAQAALRLRQDDLAVEALQAALELGLVGAARDKAQAAVDERLPKLARLALRGPERTEVRVRGRVRGVLPLARPLLLFAGDSRIELRRDGQRVERVVALSGGATSELDVSDAFGAAPPPPAPWAPAAPPWTPPPAEPRPADPSVDRTGHWLLGVGLGVAVSGVVTAIAAQSAVTSSRSSLASRCARLDGTDACAVANPGERDRAQSDVDAIATYKSVRLTGYLATGVGTATAIIGIALWPRSGERARPSPVSISVTSAGPGVWASGSF